MRKKGWYYHWDWACTDEPEYWDGKGASPLLDGPFKTKKLAYKDQEKRHRHDAMESMSSARWCKERAREEHD